VARDPDRRAWRRGDDDAVKIAMGFVACIVAMRVFKGTLPPNAHLMAFAALWVSYGGAVVRIKPLAGAALVASGLAYAGVAYTGSPTHYGVPLMVVADISGYAALAALLIGAGGGRLHRHNRPFGLGRDSGRGRVLVVHSHSVAAQKKKA
jgi:hypothetical protein